jgi:hypothetical protein
LSDDSETLYIKVISTSSSEEPVRFNISEVFQPKSVRVELIAPPSLASANTMANPNALKIERGEAQIDGQSVNTTIPKYGAVILTITQDEHSDVGFDNINSIQDYRLYPNHPNPFNPNTVIQYDVPRGGRVSMRIVDVLGRRVKLLFDENKTYGSYSAEWDGRDEHGKPVSSGVYVCELKADSQTLTKKMSLVR